MLNSFIVFPSAPPHQITSADPQVPTLLQVFVPGSFAGLLSDPDRSGDKTQCMGRMKKLTKTTLCATETSPKGGHLGFSSHLLNQLFFRVTCWHLEGLCCGAKLA